MDSTLGILSVIPPAVAIGLAFWRKQLLFSLFLGIWLGEILMTKGKIFSAFLATVDNTLKVTRAPGNLEIILFSILVGSLLALMRESNGFQGFIDWIERRKRFKGRKTVFILTYLLGLAVFIENYSNILVNGSTMRPLYDKLKISRERLGYFIHTTSINFVAIVTINSWGAFYMSLLATQQVERPLHIIVGSIPFNFYCLASLILVPVVMMTGLTIGPIKKAEKTVARETTGTAETPVLPDTLAGQKKSIKPRLRNMAFPVIVLLAAVFLSLYITGKGRISQGSGSSSVFYAVVISILLTSALLIFQKIFRFQEALEVIFKGMSELLPVGVLLVLALSLGDLCKRMGTGMYLADLAKHNIPISLLPAIIFGLGCVISFATGTSYGTFSIMVPIAMPMASLLNLNPALMLAACLSGGVFGDNCSPISDTSIVTGMAARINVIDHIKTQLPYALISAVVACLLFISVGLLI